MWIGLVGPAQSGKDTTGAYLVDRYAFTRFGFADALKNFVYDTDRRVRTLVDSYGWERGKCLFPDEVRTPLIVVGQAAKKHFSEDVWISQLLTRFSPEENVVITDVRSLAEAETVRKNGGIVVAVEGRGDMSKETQQDTEILMRNADTWLDNAGSISDLHVQLDALMVFVGAREVTG